MNQKKNVLIFTSYYLPGYKSGGVLRTLANTVDALKDEFDFYIITKDHESDDPTPFSSIEKGKWNQVGPAKVFYLSDSEVSVFQYYNLLKSIHFDFYFFNSFFDVRFTFLPFVLRFFRIIKRAPIVLAPRGEFTPASMEEKTGIKKVLFRAFDLLRFPKKLTWLASSEEEAKQIRGFFKVPFDGIRIAPDIPKVPKSTASLPINPRGDELKVISLSRIHPSKGTLDAFKAIAGTTERIDFKVYGPIENQNYWSKCLEVAESFGDNIRFSYCGSVESEKVQETFSQNDLFLFPTPGENYGHVIAEAFSVGTLVLVSDKTPWKDFESRALGSIVPLENITLFSQKIDELARLPKNALLERKSSIKDRCLGFLNIESSIRKNIEIFKHAENSYLGKSSSNIKQECINCLMDTTDPFIMFNEEGLCDGCDNFYNFIKPNWNNSDSSISEIQKKIDEVKSNGKGKKYDCIIGVSGGLDSSYLVYCAVKKLNLRPLLFHCDAGWNTAQAVWNINCLVEGLNLDLHTHVIEWQEMRELQLAFFHSQIPDQDLPQDGAFFSALYDYAIKNGIKYVLTGANFSTECSKEPQQWGGYPGIDKRLYRDIMKRFGGVKLKKFPLIDVLIYKIFYRIFYKMQVLRPLNHLRYIKKEAEEVLNKELGWKPFPHKHHESRFTKFYEDYWMPQKFGYDRRRSHFSSLVLTEQLTKDEALKRLNKPFLEGQLLDQEIKYISRKLEITPTQLDKIFRKENQTFRDYKNKYDFIILGSTIFRALGLERRRFR